MNRPSLPALLGLLLCVAVLLAPFWINRGRDAPAPPALDEALRGPCVLEVSVMRREHMLLLGDWRDQALRDNLRLTDSPAGTFPRSLRACFECHNRAGFCDVCHNSLAVRPVCWQCHHSE